MRGYFDNAILSYGYNDSGSYSPWYPRLGLGAVILNHVDPDSAGPADVRLVREAEVVAPSDMIAAADAVLFGWAGPPMADVQGGASLIYAYGNVLALLGVANPGAESKGVDYMRRRHGGIWNVVFCDGHVESLKTKALWDPQSPTIVQRWNRDHQPHLQ